MDNSSRSSGQPPAAYSILHRTVLFLTLFLTSLLLFYIIGNYQEFVDADQLLILTAVSVTACLLVVFALSGFAASLFLFFRKNAGRHRTYLYAAVRMASASGYGVVCLFAARIIEFLSHGM
jgi:hypothetical protein